MTGQVNIAVHSSKLKKTTATTSCLAMAITKATRMRTLEQNQLQTNATNILTNNIKQKTGYNYALTKATVTIRVHVKHQSWG